MKRTPLVRRTPLVAKTPLRRTGWVEVDRKPRTPLKASHKLAVPAARRKTLEQRSGGACEMQLDGCTWYATDPCHRITTKAGGRKGAAKEVHDRLSDLLHGCRNCHDASQGNHAECGAEGYGYVLKEHHNPLQVPVLYRGQTPVFLLDDGSLVDYEAVGA
jgi:hypothetical protein